MRTQTLSTRWQTIIATAMALGFLVVFFGTPAQAQAQTDSTESETTQTQEDNQQSDSFVPDEYTYTVEECNNFTLLVRRSIQYYDAARAQVELEQAEVIYAETNIVQDLNGSDLIYPGQVISIPSSIIADYVDTTDELTENQRKAWQSYVAFADFELDDIDSDNVTQQDSGEVVDDSDNSNEPDETAEPEGNNDLSQDDENSDEAGFGWWILGIGAIGVIWYTLWQRESEEE